MSSHPPRTITLKTGEICVIREAEPRDAKSILDATFATLRAPDAEHSVSTPEEFSLSVDDEVAWVRKHQEQPGWIALVPEVDGTIVGLINFKNGPRTRIAHQGALGMNVHPDWRGRGIGDALLAELLAWARACPVVEKVGLAVVVSNEPARRLYEKHGFIEEGRRVRAIKYEEGRYEDDILMYVLV